MPPPMLAAYRSVGWVDERTLTDPAGFVVAAGLTGRRIQVDAGVEQLAGCSGPVEGLDAKRPPRGNLKLEVVGVIGPTGPSSCPETSAGWPTSTNRVSVRNGSVGLVLERVGWGEGVDVLERRRTCSGTGPEAKAVNTVVVPSPTETGMPAALNVARLPLATAAPEQSADAKIRTTDVDAGTLSLIHISEPTRPY